MHFRVTSVAVALLTVHEGLHISRADDLHFVPDRIEFARPAKGAGAGIDDDRLWLDPGNDRQR